MGDRNRGFIPDKFYVARVDGASVLGGKHHNCEYFVLDLDHDPHAIAAIRAYADSCGRNGYELLARDLLAKITEREVEGSAPPQGERE